MIALEIDGVQYELPNLINPSIKEARETKEATGGLGHTKVLQAMMDGDPDVVAALILMAMRRVDPRTTKSAIDDIDLMAVMRQINQAFLALMPDGDLEGFPTAPAAVAGDVVSDPVKQSSGE